MFNPTTGPFLKIAALCEKTIEDKDGVLSLVRIVDNVNVNATDGPEAMPSVESEIKLVVSFVSGQAEGEYSLSINLKPPTDEERNLGIVPIHFFGSENTTNVIINLTLSLKEEGNHWFKISLNDEFFTQIPLKVSYQRTQLSENS